MKKTPVIILVCILWIIFGAVPIVFFWQPGPPVVYFNNHPTEQLAGKAVLCVLLFAALAFIWRHDGEGKRTKLVRYAGFALLAGLLTDLHYDRVDANDMPWQLQQYIGILNHNYFPPDQYRFLSQGTLWWMVLTNGDFVFSYVVFRFFFTLVLCLAIYRLARCYLEPQPGVMVVFLYGAFYPMSTRFYFGNLLDPMSHLVMLSAFYYARQKKFREFFSLFVLGVFIKETMLLLAPCYWLMNLEGTRPWAKQNLERIVLLAVTGLLVFFACRLPFHFNYDFETLNRTAGSMLYANLGFAHVKIDTFVPVVLRYAHPVVFLLMWWPLLIWQRRRLPASLFWTSLYFSASLLAVNTVFGWNYESRNFIPAFVLLLTGTMIILTDWIAGENQAANAATE
jgi:hypothetical protein